MLVFLNYASFSTKDKNYASQIFAKFGTIAAVIVLISLLTKKQVNGKYQLHSNITGSFSNCINFITYLSSLPASDSLKFDVILLD